MTLLDCFHDLLAYVFLFVKHGASGQPSFEQLRQQINTMLAEAANRAERLDIPKERIQRAEFAVCTWIDETLIASQWESRFIWVANLLQRERYGISNAGDVFYERLNALLPDEKDVRKVFLACISFGFEGRYFGGEKKRERQDIRLRAIADVYGSSQKGLPQVLFPEALPPMQKNQRPKRTFDYKKPLVTCICSTMAIFLIWGIYSLILDDSLDTIFANTLL